MSTPVERDPDHDAVTSARQALGGERLATQPTLGDVPVSALAVLYPLMSRQAAMSRQDGTAFATDAESVARWTVSAASAPEVIVGVPVPTSPYQASAGMTLFWDEGDTISMTQGRLEGADALVLDNPVVAMRKTANLSAPFQQLALQRLPKLLEAALQAKLQAPKRNGQELG